MIAPSAYPDSYSDNKVLYKNSAKYGLKFSNIQMTPGRAVQCSI
jgi:hypothetical protein